MMKRRATSLIVMLFVAGCSGGGSTSPSAGGATPVVDDLEESPTKTAEAEEPADGSRREESGARSTKPTTGRRDPVGDAGSAKEQAAAGIGDGTISMPAQGGYVYAQSGWEELCQTGTCDRSELPSQQDQRVTHLERSRLGGRFETETRGSTSRSQTLVYLVERDSVSVEEIRSVFSGGLSFETTIVPDPPILSLKLPVEVGEKWSGDWTDRRDDVDGTYRFAVVRREGGSIVLDSRLEFRGEFQGFNDLRLWIDPDHLTITAATGKLEIRSTYGTYRSEFATSLVSKP